jgi:site-specific recombinase XerC
MSDLIEQHLDWLRVDVSPYTLRDRESVLRRADRELDFGLEQSSGPEIQKWLTGPQPPAKPWTPKTKLTYYQHLWGYYGWAIDPVLCPDGLTFNPMEGLRKPKAPRSLPRPTPPEHLARMLTSRRPYLTYVLLAALAGTRFIEISRLDREHVTTERLYLYGKGNKPAVLKTHPVLWAEIEPLPPGPIARLADGRRASPQAVSARTNEYFHQRLGLPASVNMHGVRHWYATAMLEGGADLRTVQEALRHADASSTQIYTQVSNPRLAAAITGLQLPGQPT